MSQLHSRVTERCNAAVKSERSQASSSRTFACVLPHLQPLISDMALPSCPGGLDQPFCTAALSSSTDTTLPFACLKSVLAAGELLIN